MIKKIWIIVLGLILSVTAWFGTQQYPIRASLSPETSVSQEMDSSEEVSVRSSSTESVSDQSSDITSASAENSKHETEYQDSSAVREDPSSESETGKKEISQVEGTIVNANEYYTSEKVYRDMDLLCDRYPGLLSQETIGESNRKKPIVCLKLGKGQQKACVVAGIHAREHITISFTMRCIEEFAEAYQNGSAFGEYDIVDLLNRYTLYLVPMCNPDGTDITNAGEQPLVTVTDFDPDNYKLNANGVNLNRNFPYHWEEQYSDSTLKPGEEKYPGSAAASEPETRALMKLCSENDFLWLLDMHIVGNGIFWRDELNGEIPGDYAFANAIADHSGYQVLSMSTDKTVYSGGLENWFRQTFGRPALCVEMISYEQANLAPTYREYNGYFDQAVNWMQSRNTYLAALTFSLQSGSGAVSNRDG